MNMIRCYNCQRKVEASSISCPYCGRNPWIIEEADSFAIGDGELLRYNGEEKDITLPEGVRMIGRGAFESTSVRSVIIPCGVAEIDEYAFYCCHSLNYVEIPESVTSIGQYAFGDCPYLKQVSIPAKCAVADGAFGEGVKVIRY